MIKKQVMHQSALETALSRKERHDKMFHDGYFLQILLQSFPFWHLQSLPGRGSVEKVACSSLRGDSSLTQQKLPVGVADTAACSVMQFNVEQCRPGLSVPIKKLCIGFSFYYQSSHTSKPSFWLHLTQHRGTTKQIWQCCNKKHETKQLN